MSKQKHFAQMIRRGSRKRFTVASLLLVTLATILSMSARAWLARASEARPQTAQTSAQDPVAEALPQPSAIPQNGSVQTVRFTLYDVGFYPNEIHVRKGLVAIAFEDLSGGTQGLSLTASINDRTLQVGSVQRFAQYMRGKAVVNLAAGTYTITDASHPQNHAVLVVEP